VTRSRSINLTDKTGDAVRLLDRNASAQIAVTIILRNDKPSSNPATLYQLLGGSAGLGVRMSSMVELVTAVIALFSAGIFLAHAVEAYRAG
jgi:hypothetical protein